MGGTSFPWPLLRGEKISFKPIPNLEFGFTRTTELDFRPEAVYTDPPTPRSYAGQYIYYSNFYHDLYTNKGYIIRGWIGRMAKGFQGWTTYWFSPRTSLQVGHRHTYVASDFIPHGETLNDGSAKVIGGWASSLACRPCSIRKMVGPRTRSRRQEQRDDIVTTDFLAPVLGLEKM